jgi:subtilisin family serine protease
MIAVIDGGIALDTITHTLCHQDLIDSARYILDTNLIEHNSYPMCRDWHGTHVIGIVSAMTNNIEGIAGVIWNCKILVIREFSFTGQGSSDELAYAI